jgi:salicylate hydroxylase
MQATDTEIAIVGGGIGGLASAAFLTRAGFRVHVFERADALREVGAGIVVAPNAMRLLARLGLRDEIEAAGVRLEAGWEFRRWEDGRLLSSQPLGDTCVSMYGDAVWTLHRADLLSILQGAVPPDLISVGCEAVRVENGDEKAIVTFRDGSIARADCVIAADGLHSVLREQIATISPPVFSHLCAWRALVPVEKTPEFAHHPTQTLWLGPSRHVVHYPVSAGRLVNIVVATPAATGELDSWDREGDPAEMLAEFEGWHPPLRELLAAVDRVGRWAIFDRDPIDEWVVGRLALLGDAAHPMLAFFAQGAAQAIEDAAALAVCLQNSPEDLPGALRRYQAVRAQRANHLLQMSRGRQGHHHFPDGPGQEARDRTLGLEDPLAASDWIYSYDAELEAQRAHST